MINTADLRIGNWIQDEHEIVQYVYHLWKGGGELAEDENGGDDLDYEDKEMFGIPITKEWLDKFGFENDYSQSWRKSYGENYVQGTWIFRYSFHRNDKESFQVSQGHGGEDCTWVFPQKPQYVHQLQNIYFTLTGHELQIS